MTRRILFVDDERALLDGLRSRLRQQRGVWEMVFVDSGPAAIAELERASFDVIVSDMRMPGMDGAQLLLAVSQRWPRVARIVLSGYAEHDQVMRLVPVAHQYLSKPCDAEHLIGVIERCLKVQGLVSEPAMRGLAGHVRQLPVEPRALERLRAALSDDDATIDEIVGLVASDAALAAKTLQVANSAFFRLARPIFEVRQAVAYLGFGVLRSLVLAQDNFVPWDEVAAPARFDAAQAQAHSALVAACAKALGEDAGIGREAFIAGLLHDFGLSLLAKLCPDATERAAALAREQGTPLWAAERDAIGATHAQLGAYILGIWGLPFAVVEAVAEQDAPEAASPLGRILQLAHAYACERLPHPLAVSPAPQAGPEWERIRRRLSVIDVQEPAPHA